jgi:hypothetical protein
VDSRSRGLQAAFQTLNEAFCTTPVLAYRSQEKDSVVYTDISNIEIGVLSEIEDTLGQVKAYYSETLNNAEKITTSPGGYWPL